MYTDIQAKIHQLQWNQIVYYWFIIMAPASFLSLPLEVRHMIYDLIFLDNSPIVAGDNDQDAPTPLSFDFHSECDLLRVEASTPEIASEIRAVYFRNNTFWVASLDLEPFLSGCYNSFDDPGSFDMKYLVKML